MTVEEMHIGIDMGLQKVNTYTQKNLLPQEKDFFLNGEVLKFIKQRINPLSNVKRQGIDETIKRLEDLSDLKKTVILPIRKISNSEGICIFPSDYYSYISSSSNIYQLCSNEVINPQTTSYYKCTFPLNFDPLTTLTSYSITLNKPSGNVELFNIDNLPSGYLSDIDINKQKFMLLKSIKILVPEVLDTVDTGNYDFYWENYSNEFNNNKFVLISNEIITNITIDINGDSTVINPESLSYNNYTFESDLWSKNRLPEEEYYEDNRVSSLSGSRPDSILANLKKQILKIEFPKSVICSQIKLTYFQKPSLIDIYLHRNLNLKDTVEEEIVNNTIRFLKGVFNGDYNTYLQENIMIE